MAPDNNWLSFSLNNPSSQSPSDDTHHFYSFADNFYAAGWSNPKPQGMLFSEPENHHHHHYHNPLKEQSRSSVFAGCVPPPPKLEDFFAGGESTETQDSSLTHIAGAGYFTGGEHQELKNFTGFQAFSTNSSSEVDDSTFVGQTQSPVESGSELVVYSQCPPVNPTNTSSNGLTLGVNNNNINNNRLCPNPNNNTNESAIVPVDSDNCKKIADTFGQRTSIYRGVTRHRWTGRYEAHLWDNSCRREGQARKGRQVYLGGYDKEDKAARAYDLAALKYWGPTATTNFPISNYGKELEEMKNVTRQEFIASLRRKSSGFSRGASIYRGVTRHHQQGRWQARIGRVAGNKDLYLGTFATEEEAAEAYDIAAIKFRGVNAVTNFEMNRYDVEAIAKSPLPIGGTAKRLRLSIEAEEKHPLQTTQCSNSNNNNSSNRISFSAIQPTSTIPYGLPLDAAGIAPQYYHLHHHFNFGQQDPSMVNPVNHLMPSQECYIWPHQSY